MVEIKVIKNLSCVGDIKKEFNENTDILFVFKNESQLPELDFYKHTGFDLKTLLPVELKEGETILAQTGAKWVAPQGYYLSIVPRSGVSLNTPIRLANTPGTVEASYRGDISLLLHFEYGCIIKQANYKGIIYRYLPDDKRKMIIPAQSRLAQAIIHKTIFAKNDIKTVYFVINEELYKGLDKVFPSERGINGFGSTGIK